MTSKEDHAFTPTAEIAQMVLYPANLVILSLAVALMVYRKQYKTSHHILVLSLFCTYWVNMLWCSVAIFFLVYDPANNSACVAFGLAWQFFPLVIFFYEATICLNLFRMIVLLSRHTIEDLKISNWLNWSAALLLTALPMTTGDFGKPVCWINATSSGNIWRIVTFTTPLIISLSMVTVLYLYIVKTMCSVRFSSIEPGQATRSLHRSAIMFSFAYPFLFLICWVPVAVDIFYTYAHDTEEPTVAIVMIITQNLHPTFSVCAYLFPSIIPLLKSCCSKHTHSSGVHSSS